VGKSSRIGRKSNGKAEWVAEKVMERQNGWQKK
jgi:hypothetical protein